MSNQQTPQRDPGLPADQAAPRTEHGVEQVTTSGGAYVAGSVNTGGGVFVGRDNIVLGPGASLTIAYNPITPATLRAQLRTSFATLLDDRTGLFGGRHAILQQIASFIEQPAGGYLVVTAPAGFGKTAVTATVVRSNEAAFAYHFFTTRLSDSLTELFFLQNVVEQMAAWHKHSERLPDRLADLRALYHHFINLPSDRTRVLVLDGLDEVTQWDLAQYLGRQLPQGLKLILTVRDVGQDWAADYGLPNPQVQHLPMGGLERNDIVEALRVAGGPAAGVAADATLVDQILRVAAYEADQRLGADPLYVRLLIEDLRGKKLDAQTITKQPSGLNTYLEAWWKEVRQSAGEAAQDLVGTLAVALGPLQRSELEAINPSLVRSWTTTFNDVLEQVRRFVAGDEVRGYVLAHPRLQQFMRRQPQIDPYPDTLLRYCADWQRTRSPYALTYYVQHLKIAGTLDALFSVVLDPAFRDAQQAELGDKSRTLSDIQLALDLALDQNDMVRVLACAGAYRATSQSRHITEAIFTAIDESNWNRAVKRAELHRIAPDWSRLLWLYLAWETALAGEPEVTQDAVQRALRMPVEHDSSLFDRLLVRIAHALAESPASDRDAAGWLQALEPVGDPDELLATLSLVPIPDASRQQELVSELDRNFGYYSRNVAAQAETPQYASEFYAAEMDAEPYSDEEHAGQLAQQLRDILIELAPTSVGSERIRIALAGVLPNPYPRYRDIGLRAIGAAVVALPDPDAVRAALRSILQTAMEREGVIFTFDLPAVLLAEASRRQRVPAKLVMYLQQAEEHPDRWGTALRIHSAQACALFRLGRMDQAFDRLRLASQQDGGFAGYLSVALLSLANRCFEVGRPELIRQPVWGRNSDRSLMQGAYELASRVRDPAFREERLELVRLYDSWMQEDRHDVQTALANVRSVLDEDVRNACIEYASARWSWPPTAPQWDALKSLVPLALAHGTTLDAVLGRLVRLRAASLTDTQLTRAINICADDFTAAQPWQHRQWR